MPAAPKLQNPGPSATTPGGDGDGDFTRLHITPLDPELFPIILPPPLRATARNVSFHSIETFPEKRYAFLELPAMEAEKLRKKLHGSVLKGTKMRIEKARPEKRTSTTEEDEKPDKKRKKSAKDDATGEKKRKRDRDVLEGAELKDRKVKRGWTEPSEHKQKKSKRDKDEKAPEKKKRTKSKYTDSEELLFKTKVPPNATANLPDDGTPKKKKKKGKAREVTVHEFEKTTKFPSFLKNSSGDTDTKTTEFVDGKGWVDDEGNVVETAKQKTRSAHKVKAVAAKADEEDEDEKEDEDDTSSSGSSSASSASDEVSESEEDAVSEPDEEAAENDSEQKNVPMGKPSINITPVSATKLDSTRPASSSSAKSLTIKIPPPPPQTPSAEKLHPLEALYKRRSITGTGGEPSSQEKSFSFFGADNDADEAPSRMSVKIPMTPFTKQDFDFRTTRSAAPTPDTAHPSRAHNFWASQSLEDDALGDMDQVDEEDEEDEEGEEAQEATQGTQGTQGSSDFQSWFWENRGELNRSWMKRRKTTAKEKRHRENKARASKAV